MPSALVTGANRGLGLAVATLLAEQGFTVHAGARDPGAMPSIAGDVRPVALDVADDASVLAACAQLDALDVLVNNAAIGNDPEGVNALDADFDVVRAGLETNTFGPWRTARACAHLLRASDRGRIVNVSSEVASLATMHGQWPSYLLSKAALNAVTRMLAWALRDDGVLVNSVCPGWVATRMGGEGGRPPAEAAVGVVWAATLPDDGPTGGFFQDGRPLPW